MAGAGARGYRVDFIALHWYGSDFSPRATDQLRAYLDALGDIPTAAASLGVHRNTYRYRLRRLVALAGLDMADPVERLVLHLQLHLRSADGDRQAGRTPRS